MTLAPGLEAAFGYTVTEADTPPLNRRRQRLGSSGGFPEYPG